MPSLEVEFTALQRQGLRVEVGITVRTLEIVVMVLMMVVVVGALCGIRRLHARTLHNGDGTYQK